MQSNESLVLGCEDSAALTPLRALSLSEPAACHSVYTSKVLAEFWSFVNQLFCLAVGLSQLLPHSVFWNFGNHSVVLGFAFSYDHTLL